MDLLGWLAGTWSVDRAINGQAHAFTGTAAFTPEDENTVRWEERGRLVLGAFEGDAFRTLFIVRGDGAADHEVRFDDGRPFHPLTLTTGSCAAEHLCGADVYRGAYTVEADDRLRVVWHVDGPRKRDVIESVYTRQAP
jgi:hypothetical protein